MEDKIDRRVIKTKGRLYEVFIKLLREKPIKDITVRELSDKADINRATFYLHYKDVFDLLEQIEEEIISEFTSVFENFSQNFTNEDFLYSFKELLKFIEENKDLCIGLFIHGGDKKFFEKLVNILMSKCFEKNKYSRYGFAFAMAGCVGVIIEWIKDEMIDDIDSVATTALILINKLK